MAELDASVQKLPLAAAACPHMSRRQREAVVTVGAWVSVADGGQVAGFLHRDEPLEPEKSEWIDSVFNTELRRSQLRNAIRTFLEIRSCWFRDGGRDSLSRYLIPDPAAQQALWIGYDSEWLEILQRSELGKELLLSASPQSLATISVEAILGLSKLRASDRSLLLTAYRRGTKALGVVRSGYPWEDTPPEIAALPLSWLYAYTPVDRLWHLITRLSQASVKCVGHLSVLDRPMWSLVHSIPMVEWMRLARDLDASLQVTDH